MKIKRILKTSCILVIIFIICIFCFQSCTGRNHIHYKNKDFCFVVVYVGSGRSQETYSGTMSVEDYTKWTNGENGTVFIYTDSKAKYGYRLNISSITHISNYGDTPYAYD